MSEKVALSLDVRPGRWKLTLSPSGVPAVLEGQDGRVIASFGPGGGEAVFALDASEHLWLVFAEAPDSRRVTLEPAGGR